MKTPFQRQSPNKVKKTNIFAAAAIKSLEIEVQAAWVERDMGKCIQLLHKVLEFNPHKMDVRLLMGRAHGMQFEYDAAIDVLEKAVETAPKHERPLALLKAGTMARNFYDPSIAESFFEEAVELAGTVQSKLHLAEFLLRIRKRDAAKTLVDEVLATAPDDAATNFLWCRLNEARHDDCLDKLNKILRTQTADLKAKAGYQLAKMLDLAGDYDAAIQALVTAKTVLMPGREAAVQNRQKNRAKLIDLARGFDTEKHTKWQVQLDQLNPLRKLALLGGHPRSGTTLLEQVLDSHPGIISAEETEIFFMCSLSPLMRKQPPDTALLNVLNSSSTEDRLGARDRYYAAIERCLGVPVGSRLLIDKNPSLTALVPAMFRIFPEIKYVMMLRDPRDVVLSCYMQSFVPVSGVNANYLTLEDTAAEYAAVMGIWTEVRDRFEGNSCEIRYEDMVEDLEGNARKVLGFLGMDWNEAVMDYDRHARDKVVRSPTAAAVTEKVHSRAKNRWKNYEKHLEPIFETLKPCLKALGYE
jgi:tetratricopeptide (TPR) repeat protein